MITPTVLVIIALVAVLALIVLHVPVGAAMTVVGITGFAMMTNWTAALSLLSAEPGSLLRNIDIAVIPLFLLMGSLANVGGLADDIYTFAARLVGHIRGGLAMATILGCGLFGSIAGSSVATTASFGTIAVPQMRSRGYQVSLAAGSVGVGGTLGAMVPPSVILVVYGLISEQFILDLFAAAILPALLAVLGYLIVIAIVTRLNPEIGPAAPKASRAALLTAARSARAAAGVFVFVSGGIYSGIFTVTEAASIGTLATGIIAFVRGKLNRDTLKTIMRDTASSTAMIYFAIFGASILSYFIGLTRVADDLVLMLETSSLPPFAVILVLCVMYLVLGAIFDEMAAMLVTLPFVLPVVVSLGYDPVWWGIVNLILINLGMITPPIGLNVFVLKGLSPDISLAQIYRGVMPFIAMDLLRLGLVLTVPGLALWLPRLLG